MPCKLMTVKDPIIIGSLSKFWLAERPRCIFPQVLICSPTLTHILIRCLDFLKWLLLRVSVYFKHVVWTQSNSKRVHSWTLSKAGWSDGPDYGLLVSKSYKKCQIPILTLEMCGVRGFTHWSTNWQALWLKFIDTFMQWLPSCVEVRKYIECELLSQALYFVSSHTYFLHFSCEQLIETLWMPLRGDFPKVCTVILIYTV